MNFIRKSVSFCLAVVLLFSLAGPVTVHADLLEYSRILPAACDHFGEMEDWLYSDDSNIVVFIFQRKKDPHTEMQSFAKAMEAYDLVLKTDEKTKSGDRQMELASDGVTCVALIWDSSEGRLLVGYEEDAVTLSREEDKTVLYLGMGKWSEINDFVKQCGNVLGTTAEKATKLVNGDRTRKLTKDDKTVVALRWHTAAQILEVTFHDDSAAQKMGFSLGEEEAVDPYSHALPDLASFLNTKYTQDVWGYTHYVTCLVSRSDRDAIVEAVLDLLLEPQYQLKQMGKSSDSEGTHYTFEYTGKNEDVDWVYLKAGGKYHAKLTVKSYGSNQTALIFYTHPEFYLEDPGKTWKDQETDPDPNPTTDPDPVPDSGETVKVREDTTIRIKKGSSVKLHCTYDEWGSSYDVYEWSIQSGSSVISIDGTHNKCDVLGKEKGTAVIRMKYSYSYEGSDVLTGLPRTKHTSKTREYTIIVE